MTVVTSLLAGGCTPSPVATIHSDVPQEMQAARAQLKQEITRAEVREILGSPYLQNDFLRVEAYRMTGTDVDFQLAFVLPIPVPGERHTYHFFVAYDEAWKVFDSDSDVAKSPFRLVAADLVLATTFMGDRPEVLLATREMSQLALSTRPSPGTCALILLSDPIAMERVLVDGDQVIELGSATLLGDLYNTFSRHEIDAGEHTIEVAQQSVTGRFRQQFECKPETFNFVSLDALYVREYWSWQGVAQEGQLVITTDPPRNAHELRQILAHDDDWYGFAESYYSGLADRRGNAADSGTELWEPMESAGETGQTSSDP